MSNINNIIKKPLKEIREFVEKYQAEVKNTPFENTYIIKFNHNTDYANPEINDIKGLIFNTWNNKIYALGYPVPIEIKDQTPEQQEKIIEKIKNSNGKYTVQEALDGTLIRFWYHEDTKQWVISTNGVANAYQSIWMNNISYGELFTKTFQKSKDFMDNLNKEHVYLFTLCHPLNVIVVNHTEPKIYHVATYDRTNYKEISENIDIETSPNIDINIDQVLKNIKDSHGTPVKSAGYLVILEDTDGIVRRYRFENDNYTIGRNLRGECNNINHIILSHILNKDINDFLLYYPIYKDHVTEMTQKLDKLAGILYENYGNRYKKGHDIFINPRHHYFLGIIHKKLYLNTLKPAKKTVQLADIEQFIKNFNTEQILYLLFETCPHTKNCFEEEGGRNEDENTTSEQSETK